MSTRQDDFIEVRNPRQLGVSKIPAQRIPMGVPDDYKPCIAKLPSGELWVVAFHQHQQPEWKPEDKYRDIMLFFRSQDGGMTWSDDDQSLKHLMAQEPYFSITSDGTIFITSFMISQYICNPLGYGHGYLHRSDDMGQTWETIRLSTEEIPGAAPKPSCIWHSRNVLEMADGSLIYGVDVQYVAQYLWRSHDGGKTWDRSLECSFDGKGLVKAPSGIAWWPDGLGEVVFWQARNGDLLGIFRVAPDCFPPIPGTKQIIGKVGGQYQRLVVFRSRDGGQHWTMEKELGSYYGEMYPAVLRLDDARLLLTFTVRGARSPLGVHAVFGRETDDGFEFDFEHDRLVLDAQTPINIDSGGGFGPTVQLDDGTLVTAYSWRDRERLTHIEAMRWKLPPAGV